MDMIICGNFAKKNQCGTCKKFWLWGISTGACGASKEKLKEMICTDICDCGQYEEGTPIQDI